MAKKTIVYVDSFNLYYGALKNTPHKWLNIDALCRLLLPKNDIVEIKFFTARVKPRPGDRGQSTRQHFYFRALSTLADFSIYYGHFLTHPVWMTTVSGTPKRANVWKTEEKGSDVNLASHLLMDAFRNRFEVAVIVSNDSDLLTPISLVRREFGKVVGILNPQKNVSRPLAREADFVKSIRKGALSASQFPDKLTDAKGAFHKPKEWR